MTLIGRPSGCRSCLKEFSGPLRGLRASARESPFPEKNPLDKFHKTVVILPSMTLKRQMGQGRLRLQALRAGRAVPSATADVCQTVGHHPFGSFTGRICRSSPANRFPSKKIKLNQTKSN
jgi:hypothetical protein